MSSIRSLNPFNDRGYVQLPTTESSGAPLPAPTRREEEEGWFARESSSAKPEPTMASWRPIDGRPLHVGNMCIAYSSVPF